MLYLIGFIWIFIFICILIMKKIREETWKIYVIYVIFIGILETVFLVSQLFQG
jgi:predicted membrane channel-forming protein YqfA (hemolysin III family)